ncbi:MAG: Na/Pi symporter [Bacteroidota bacterium]
MRTQNNSKIGRYLRIIIITLIILSNSIYSIDTDSTKAISIDSSKISLFQGDKPNDNGPVSEAIHSTAGELIEKPLRVRVLSDGQKPVKGWPVYFEVISIPAKAKGTSLENETILTDSDGYAESYATLGSKSGFYKFSARIYNGSEKNDIIYFKAHARNSNWLFYLISGLVGGLGLFLFGMQMMSEGMKKSAGSRLRTILAKLTDNRFIALAVGTFVTMVIQSSSATTVMLVSFVQAKLLTFTQSLGIIFGSNIGTTITAQLVAFKLTDYALIFIGLGFAFVFLMKSKKYRNFGEVILGFGLLFFGMYIMSEGMKPLRTFQPFIDLLLELENPIFGILVGALFTGLIQSSSAFTGIVIILATQGFLTLEAGIPLIFGANIGTCITAWLASINTSREAKRVALGHILFQIFGVVIFIWWIPSFAEFIRWISPESSPELTGIAQLADVVPRQIANAHTVFNVVVSIMILPFINQTAALVIKFLPDKKAVIEEESPYEAKFLDEGLISTPTLALNLAKAEILNMAKKVQSNVSNIIRPFQRNDDDICSEIKEQEREIDFLVAEIKNYINKISQESSDPKRIDEVFQMLYSITEFEQIGDIVSRNLRRLARKKMKSNVEFSKTGIEDIINYHTKTLKQISRAIALFKDVNLEDAEKMERKYKKYRLLEVDFRRTHFDRLREDIPETVATSEMHLELLDQLKRISSHATNVARILLEHKNEDDNNNDINKEEINNSNKNEL